MVFVRKAARCEVVLHCLTTFEPTVKEELITATTVPSEEPSEKQTEITNEEKTEDATTGPSEQPIEEKSSTPVVNQSQEFVEDLSTTEEALPTAKPMQPIVCPPSNGIMANPNDCHSFYICANGLPYLFACPETLVFNNALLVCDWPYNVSAC